MYELYNDKLRLLAEKTTSLLESKNIQVNRNNTLKSDFKSLKDYFSSEFNIVINQITNLIEETQKININLENNKNLENKEVDSDESPASMLSNKFRSDEVFSILRKSDYTWELFTLDEPMILNQIYKLRLNEFKSSDNNYAIEVGISPKKYYKYQTGSLSLVFGYLVKNGYKFSSQSEEKFSVKAEEGDIIGVALSIANDDNYNLEIFRNGESLGIAFELPVKDYYFYYGLCTNTSIEISECYSHYENN